MLRVRLVGNREPALEADLAVFSHELRLAALVARERSAVEDRGHRGGRVVVAPGEAGPEAVSLRGAAQRALDGLTVVALCLRLAGRIAPRRRGIRCRGERGRQCRDLHARMPAMRPIDQYAATLPIT